MLTFFRRIRKGLLGDGATSKYLLYAIGEIALVVIGILIALQINNWNTSKTENLIVKNYLAKICNNVKSDIESIQQMIKVREAHSAICAEALKLITDKDFEDQETIREAIWGLISEQSIEFNRSGFESLKNSGFLQNLSDNKIENLLYKYYKVVDKAIFEENSYTYWKQELDIELVKTGFIVKYFQIEKFPNTGYSHRQANYDNQLSQHEGHLIMINLLSRGAHFKEDIKGYYEKQIDVGNELLYEINKFVNK